MKIRLFRKDEQQLLKQAIHDVWGRNHILSYDDSLLHHMFFQTPNHTSIATKEEFSFLGVWDQNKVIGLLGVMTYTFNQYGKKGKAYSLTNWIVEEQYRHTGAGLQLIQYVLDLKPEMVLSLGVGEGAAPIYKLMRWEMNMDVPRWIGLQKKEEVVDALLDSNSHAIRYYNEIHEVLTARKAKRIQALDDELWNEFYWNIFAKDTIGIARDAAFLNWRYFNHPTFDYIALAVKDGEQYEGLAIVRIEEVTGGSKIGRIVEMMYSTQDSAVALANAIVHLDESVLFYDFYSFSTVSTWGLEAVGFKRVYKTEEDPFVLPTRFQPVDLEITSMISAIYLTERSKEKFNVALDQQWYITKGDADQDRPN